MKRKITVFPASVMLFALCGSVDAQQTEKVFRIGYLDSSNASGSAVLVDVFRQELSKLGWFAGKNITVDYRFTQGRGPQARPNWTSATSGRLGRRRPPTERAQACGAGTEAEIGGDRDPSRHQKFRECLSNHQAEAGGRDYDDRHSPFFRR